MAWTLSYEVYFYLLFGIALLFSYRFLPVFLLLWATAIMFADKSVYIEHLPDAINIIFAVVNVTFILGAFIAIGAVKKLYIPAKPALILGFLSLLAAVLKRHALINFDNDFHPRLLLLGIPSGR